MGRTDPCRLLDIAKPDLRVLVEQQQHQRLVQTDTQLLLAAGEPRAERRRAQRVVPVEFVPLVLQFVERGVPRQVGLHLQR